MLIWTVKEGEPLPLPECPGRIMRCGIISQMLSDRGNTVIWWTSAYFHQKKCLLRESECVEKIKPNYLVHLLRPRILYKHNISIKRALYSLELSKLFRKAAESEEKPDLIYCSYPLIDLAYEVVKYAKVNNVPVVIDIRDLWPDIFYSPVPPIIKPVVKIAFHAEERKATYCMKNADMVMGIVPHNLDWAYKRGRMRNPNDQVVYIGYNKLEYTSDQMSCAMDFWHQLQLSNDDFIVCYFGTIIERVVDFSTVLEAAIGLRRIKFVICGEGESLSRLKKKYAAENIIFPGYIDQDKIEALMSIASIGILPYKNTENFVDSITNKPFEYMSGGLCIITSITGLLKKIIEENKCGFVYTTTSELVDILQKLYIDRKLLEQTKCNSRKLYKEQFTAKTIYTELCIWMEKMANNVSQHAR